MRLFTLCLPLVLAVAQPSFDPHSLDSHFENDQVILNAPHPGIAIPGAAAGKNWHNHPLNRVMVYIHNGGEKLTYLDGSVEDLKWQAGTVRWSPAAGYHYSELPPELDPRVWKTPAFTTPMIVDIGIKKPGYPGKVAGTALDPLRVASQRLHVGTREQPGSGSPLETGSTAERADARVYPQPPGGLHHRSERARDLARGKGRGRSHTRTGVSLGADPPNRSWTTWMTSRSNR